MAINYELLNSGAMTVGGGFNLYSKNPLDSRLVIPAFDGLQTLIDNGAAYEGMIVYISSEKKHYEVKTIDGALSYRQFGLTNDELNELITNATTAAMEFKGVAATLPENPAKGDMYKVSGETIDITIDGVAAKVGDSIVYNGEQWFLIPSGDDIEDTWRPVTDVNNDATLTFKAGEKLDVAVAATGDITYSHETIAAPTNTNAEGDAKVREYITSLETDGYGHITGYKTNTEVVEDTNTTYDFECASEHSNVYFTVKEKLNGEEVAEHTVCVDAYNKNEIDTELAKVAEAAEKDASDKAAVVLVEAQKYADAEISDFNTETIAPLADRVKAIEDAPYATEAQVNTKLDAKDWVNTDSGLRLTETYNMGDESLTLPLITLGADAEGGLIHLLEHGDGRSAQLNIDSLTFYRADGYGRAEREYCRESIKSDGTVITFPDKSGTFAITSDIDTAVEDLEGKIDTKLDGNGWESIDGVLSFTKSESSAQPEIELNPNASRISVNSSDGNTFVSIDSHGVQLQGAYITDIKSSGISVINASTSEKTDVLFPMQSGTFALTSDVDAALQAAKDYADDANTTYEFAATENPLEFTVTPSEGEAKTITLVAPTVDTGVMEVTAGNDIVVTPGENGKVTVAHETFTTGEYTKDPATSDKTGDVYMMTGVTVDNGHVTGAAVKSLAAALQGMTFIFDGGTSAE